LYGCGDIFVNQRIAGELGEGVLFPGDGEVLFIITPIN